MVRSTSLLLVLSACGFSARIGGDDATTTTTITDDTLEELGDGKLVDGVFVAPGTIEPDGFVLGGLHARGFQAALVDAGDTFEKVLADASAANQLGADYAQVPANWGNARPRGLGLNNDNGFTVVYDGEILLPAGAITLEADVDDRAVLQVALDRDAPTTFGPLLSAQVGGPVDKIDLVVPTAGWYPIRAAVTDDTGNAKLVLTIVQGQVRTVADADRLRARVTNDRGVVVYVFDQPGFASPNGHVARPTIDEAFSVVAPPYDLTSSFDNFSLRFAGQLHIGTKGTYTFTANLGDDNDSWRLWIDGKVVAQRWLGAAEVASATLDLDPGWHDLLVDYADGIGTAEIHVEMNGAVIDPAQLRPVVPLGNTFTFVQPTSTTIADHQMTFVQLPLPGDAYTLIDAVDVGFQVDNQDMSTLSIDLFDCNGIKPLMPNTSPSYHYYGADPSCAGKSTKPPAPWSLRFTDSATGNGLFVGLGSVRSYGIAALYHGGPRMPFSPVVTYTSGVRPTPGAIRIESVHAKGDFAGATVAVAVRTADNAAELEAAPWEQLDDGEAFVGHELAQYQVTMTTDGWHYPVLDKVEITYAVIQ